MKHRTQQRKALVECLHEASGPLSPAEILWFSKEKVPSLGIATVYRNLKLLVQEGAVAELHIPGQGSYYEPAGMNHHHHFQCRNCKQIFCIEGCPQGIKSLTPEGFELEDHEVFLYGRCSECNDYGPMF
ncbi:transcriptional repressor [Desulfonatronospira sp.]|uniref:Fur family transcriptional regulator n=1 Tax=Desulfonatronospira sp. TaxID=1962951 RepID=UPI0025C57CBE|nr:transcriptional repressor [Desulfonatronospira sp.]